MQESMSLEASALHGAIDEDWDRVREKLSSFSSRELRTLAATLAELSEWCWGESLDTNRS